MLRLVLLARENIERFRNDLNLVKRESDIHDAIYAAAEEYLRRYPNIPEL